MTAITRYETPRRIEQVPPSLLSVLSLILSCLDMVISPFLRWMRVHIIRTLYQGGFQLHEYGRMAQLETATFMRQLVCTALPRSVQCRRHALIKRGLPSGPSDWRDRLQTVA